MKAKLASVLAKGALAFTPGHTLMKKAVEDAAAKVGIPVIVTPPNFDNELWTVELDRESNGIVLSVQLSTDRIKDLIDITTQSFLYGPDSASVDERLRTFVGYIIH